MQHLPVQKKPTTVPYSLGTVKVRWYSTLNLSNTSPLSNPAVQTCVTNCSWKKQTNPKRHVLTVQCYSWAQHGCSNYNSWYSQFLFHAGVFELYNMRRNLLHTLQALQRAIDLDNPHADEGEDTGKNFDSAVSKYRLVISQWSFSRSLFLGLVALQALLPNEWDWRAGGKPRKCANRERRVIKDQIPWWNPNS